MDLNYYIKRNERIAHEIYGDKITEDRKVEGTNIWFDSYWRFHQGDK